MDEFRSNLREEMIWAHEDYRLTRAYDDIEHWGTYFRWGYNRSELFPWLDNPSRGMDRNISPRINGWELEIARTKRINFENAVRKFGNNSDFMASFGPNLNSIAGDGRIARYAHSNMLGNKRKLDTKQCMRLYDNDELPTVVKNITAQWGTYANFDMKAVKKPSLFPMVVVPEEPEVLEEW